nr:hypothetical protein [uncultured Microbacterium sp.]
MDRKLVLNAQLAIAHGHRIEVTENLDETTGESSILSITDQDTGIRYRRIEPATGDIVRWRGRVLGCTVTIGGHGAHTVLDVDAEVVADTDAGEGASARAALHGADAAADAAKAEADRWGGSDRTPEPEPDRFW